MNIRTIAVILGDNDFGHTFMPLLETVARAISDASMPPSRERVERMIRSGIEMHYLAFQCSNRETIDEGRLEHTMEYLSSVRILFDAEAEVDICVKDHDGGAWYLETITGNVYSY